ncbi:MAG: cupredoxin domain-containing protein [Candidatus Tectomicrobia bacterium]|uniref:Cupredoxin domain-containing protein n=1 Tax=Tectimicrobiota bacterium TaxID=2528274 RepID=A0A932GNE2_UNCTE|nr:cupredoxin domain-containing protein [Candidatus Tectomicrobia bacterium]
MLSNSGMSVWRVGLLGVLIGLLVLSCGLRTAQAQSVKEFLLVTGEWSWKAKEGEAPVVDRNRGAVKEIERYTFDPPFLVVNRGDTVVLKIHALKGAKHVLEIKDFGVGETTINKGEEKTIRFVANKAGTFKFLCTNHINAEKEGPMVGYIYVIGR